MTRIREIKTTFTSGEVSQDLLWRGDLKAYDNGALALTNVFIPYWARGETSTTTIGNHIFYKLVD